MNFEVTIQDEHIGIRGFDNTLHLIAYEDAKNLYVQLGTALRIYNDVIKKGL